MQFTFSADITADIDLDEIADKIKDSIDTDDIVERVAQDIDASDIAQEISAWEVADQIDVAAVAEELNMRDIANEVTDRIDWDRALRDVDFSEIIDTDEMLGDALHPMVQRITALEVTVAELKFTLAKIAEVIVGEPILPAQEPATVVTTATGWDIHPM